MVKDNSLLTKKFTYFNLEHKAVEGHAAFRLPFNEVCAFIQAVTRVIVGDTGVYAPYMQEVAYADQLLRLYTDICIDDIDALYRYASETDIVSAVEGVVDGDQIAFIKRNINVCIEREKTHTHTDRVMAQLPAVLQEFFGLIVAQAAKSQENAEPSIPAAAVKTVLAPHGIK